MTISLPSSKVGNTVSSIRKLLQEMSPKIRDVAKIIGLLVSCELAVPYGPLFRRTIENEKNAALAVNGGNFDARMTISNESVADLNWWITNLPLSFRDF